MFDYFCYEMKVRLRHPSHILVPILFFFSAILIFPFALEASFLKIQGISSGIIWSIMLLSCFIAADGFFLEDKNSGLMMRYPFLNIPIEGIFLVKSVVFFILRILPFLLILPVIGLLFNWQSDLLIRFMIMLIISGPALVFFSLLAGLLSVALGQSGHWIFVMIFPLIVPILIFAISGCDIKKPLMDVIYFPLAFSGFSAILTVGASHFIFKTIYNGG